MSFLAEPLAWCFVNFVILEELGCCWNFIVWPSLSGQASVPLHPGIHVNNLFPLYFVIIRFTYNIRLMPPAIACIAHDSRWSSVRRVLCETVSTPDCTEMLVVSGSYSAKLSTVLHTFTTRFDTSRRFLLLSQVSAPKFSFFFSFYVGIDLLSF